MSNCNENYIKEAAYYLWQNAGCPNGQDEKFWSMALEQCASSNKKSCCKKSGSASCAAAKKAPAKSSTKSSAKK